MTTTIREQIIKGVAAQLAEVTILNGFNTNCGNMVKTAQRNLDSGEYPLFVVWGGAEESTKTGYGRMRTVMTLVIEGFSTFVYPASSEVQEAILGDVIKSVTNPADPVSALIEDITYVAGGPADHPEAGDLTTATAASFQVTYEFILGNPYAQ